MKISILRVSAVLRELYPQIQSYAAKVHQKTLERHSEDLWSEATSFESLCGLMMQFVRGELSCWPYHPGPFDPETDDAELRALIERGLLAANRAGFITTGGQPALSGRDTWQLATVDGFAHGQTLERLRAVITGTPLILQANMTTRRWRTDHSTTVDSWIVDGREVRGFGARLSQRNIRFMWQGIEDYLIEEIIGMHQVTIYDPRLGDHRDLYNCLARLDPM